MQINSIEEFAQVLLMQRTATAKAILELNGAITGDTAVETSIQSAIRLLSSYAAMPTLTEHEKSEHIQGAYKKGATFGVALIVGEMLLKQLHTMVETDSDMDLLMLIMLLREVAPGVNPAELLMQYIQFDFSNKQLTEDERREKSEGILGPVATILSSLAETYELIDGVGPFNLTVTPLGKRVALHLVDVYQFANAIVAAHHRFKPTLATA